MNCVIAVHVLHSVSVKVRIFLNLATMILSLESPILCVDVNDSEFRCDKNNISPRRHPAQFVGNSLTKESHQSVNVFANRF